jgi:hypothetical protein
MFQGPAYIRVVVHDEDDPVHEVNRFPLLRLQRARQLDREGAALSALALHDDRAAVLIDDGVANR